MTLLISIRQLIKKTFGTQYLLSPVIFGPSLSNKSYSTNSRMTFLEKGDILCEETRVADTFNKFYSNVIKEFKIENDDNLLCYAMKETDRQH